MLERARSGEVAVLGDVAGEHDGDALGLREPDESVGAHPDLGDATGDLGTGGSRSVWMESTASRKGRVSRAVASTASRSRPGANGDGLARDAQPVRTRRDLTL